MIELVEYYSPFVSDFKNAGTRKHCFHEHETKKDSVEELQTSIFSY